MPLAQQVDSREFPGRDILADCAALISNIQLLLNEGADCAFPADCMDRLLRELHSIKGAVAFLDRQSFTEGLHALEGLLLDSRAVGRLPDAQTVKAVLPELVCVTGAQMQPQIVARERPEPNRFGEHLWWAHELTQTTAQRWGKRVFIVAHGGDLPISATVHEALGDSLVHLVRNAVVHGIETPEERLAAGKPAAGLTTIEAVQQPDCFVVTVSDNGAGMEPSAYEHAFEMARSSLDTANLDAGRGPGLPAVREALEENGGRVDIGCEPGQGTTFILTFPAA